VGGAIPLTASQLTAHNARVVAFLRGNENELMTEHMTRHETRADTSARSNATTQQQTPTKQLWLVGGSNASTQKRKRRKLSL
jgi:hypothetical protein